MKNHLENIIDISAFVPTSEDAEALRQVAQRVLYEGCLKSRETLTESTSGESFIPNKVHTNDGCLYLDMSHPDFGNTTFYLGEVCEKYRFNSPTQRSINLKSN